MLEVYVNGDAISTSRVRFLVACPMCNNAGRDVDEISHPCVSFCKQCNLVPLLSHGCATRCVCVCVRGTRLNRCRVTGSELLYISQHAVTCTFSMQAIIIIIVIIIIIKRSLSSCQSHLVTKYTES